MISDDELLEYVLPASADDLPVLRRLERAAVGHLEKRTGRYFRATGTVAEIIHWRGWPIPLANAPPSGTLTSVESWDGTAWSAVTASSYYYDNGFVWWNSDTATWAPATAPKRYRVTYSAGYAAGVTDEWNAPYEIKQAVAMLVIWWFEERLPEGEEPEAITKLIADYTRMAV